MIHSRCGGTLTPEQHRRWALQMLPGPIKYEPVLTDESETLHRCGRCGLIGVATKTEKHRVL